MPARYQPKYTGAFARKFSVCLITTVWKLHQRGIIHPSCVAEELAAHIVFEEATDILAQSGIGADFSDFQDSFFEDVDFEYLYDDANDRIEDTEVSKMLGIGNLAFSEWFKRFGSPETSAYTEVHPYSVDDDTPTTGSSTSS